MRLMRNLQKYPIEGQEVFDVLDLLIEKSRKNTGDNGGTTETLILSGLLKFLDNNDATVRRLLKSLNDA